MKVWNIFDRAHTSGGSTTGGPRGRYCGNLGHVQDDETGLIYMRARYYEPGTGRFVSQDPGRKGNDWFTYCSNNPVGKIDASGKEGELAEESFADGLATMLGNLGVNLYLKWACSFAGILMGASDWISKESTDFVIDYQALVEDLNTFATSNDASKVTISFNNLAMTKGGATFISRLFDAANQPGADAKIRNFASEDNPLVQLSWLVSDDD